MDIFEQTWKLVKRLPEKPEPGVFYVAEENGAGLLTGRDDSAVFRAAHYLADWRRDCRIVNLRPFTVRIEGFGAVRLLCHAGGKPVYGSYHTGTTHIIRETEHGPLALCGLTVIPFDALSDQPPDNPENLCERCQRIHTGFYPAERAKFEQSRVYNTNWISGGER